MKATGGCYCGALRYSIDGAAEAMLQCHCRECQYITGGNPNVAAVFALEDFRYISGTCLLYTSPSPRDATLSRMPSSA